MYCLETIWAHCQVNRGVMYIRMDKIAHALSISFFIDMQGPHICIVGPWPCRLAVQDVRKGGMTDRRWEVEEDPDVWALHVSETGEME